eukprot:767071-Hanusia_phi.AAC.1
MVGGGKEEEERERREGWEEVKTIKEEEIRGKRSILTGCTAQMRLPLLVTVSMLTMVESFHGAGNQLIFLKSPRGSGRSNLAVPTMSGASSFEDGSLSGDIRRVSRRVSEGARNTRQLVLELVLRRWTARRMRSSGDAQGTCGGRPDHKLSPSQGPAVLVSLSGSLLNWAVAVSRGGRCPGRLSVSTDRLSSKQGWDSSLPLWPMGWSVAIRR